MSSELQPRRPGRRRRSRAFSLIEFTMVLALIAVNAWWLVRDLWPVADLKTIQLLIGRGRYDEAEACLVQLVNDPRLSGQAVKFLEVARKRRQGAGGATQRVGKRRRRVRPEPVAQPTLRFRLRYQMV